MAEEQTLENVLTIKPNDKQLKAMLSKKQYIAYGGARGGGKSWLIDTKASLLARRYGRPNPFKPGIKICIVRRTLEDLRENHIEQLKTMLNGLAKYSQSERKFFFPNGAIIKFNYYDCENDKEHFQGKEFDIIFVDEATQMQPEWLEIMGTSCRGVNNFPHRVYYMCNPGGPGHQYIKRLFIDRVYKDDENPDDYEFIQAKITDNKALMAVDSKYLNFLNHLPPKLRSAWRDGSWDVYEGQFFEEFTNDPDHYGDKRWTHVIDPIKIRPHWPIYRSVDWGYEKPFSCGWYTVDDDGVIYRILELYGVQKSGNESLADVGVKWFPNKVFSKIHEIETEHPWLIGKNIIGVGDTQMWDVEFGESIAETAAKYQVFMDKADKKRINGWMQCHYRLAFDENGYAKFYVFRNCREFIRTLPTLQYDPHKEGDLDSSGEDHAADEWRYMLMRRPITPELLIETYTPAWGVDPLGTVYGGRQ